MADQSPRHLVLLPAMLCDEDLYRVQIAALGDLVESLPLVVAEADMAESAAAVLRRAPARFVLAGTSYGASLALEVAVTAPTRVLGLWLMGCNPGPHGHPEAASRLGGRVEAGEFEAVVEELAQRTVYGPVAGAAFRRMARRLGPTVFLQQNATLLGRHDRRGNLTGINCPPLKFWNEAESPWESGGNVGNGTASPRWGRLRRTRDDQRTQRNISISRGSRGRRRPATPTLALASRIRFWQWRRSPHALHTASAIATAHTPRPGEERKHSADLPHVAALMAGSALEYRLPSPTSWSHAV